MRRWSTCIALSFIGVFGLAVRAADKPPADYQTAMKDLGAFAEGIDKTVKADDFDTVAKLADAVKGDFEVAEKYWTNKSPDATKIAQTGGKLAVDLSAVANVKSREGVEYAVKQITDLCAGCHMAHRETMPDGTFQIK
jgi:cytochrome c556